MSSGTTGGRNCWRAQLLKAQLLKAQLLTTLSGSCALRSCALRSCALSSCALRSCPWHEYGIMDDHAWLCWCYAPERALRQAFESTRSCDHLRHRRAKSPTSAQHARPRRSPRGSPPSSRKQLAASSRISRDALPRRSRSCFPDAPSGERGSPRARSDSIFSPRQLTFETAIGALRPRLRICSVARSRSRARPTGK